jgi:hypothetical protein
MINYWTARAEKCLYLELCLESFMNRGKLFFIYVAKESEWKDRESQDWNYVLSMVRFFNWWMKRNFNISFTLDADILPVIPGHLFDRMSIGYLTRDHKERGSSTYHFYLAYFKPIWTDCKIEGYSAENFSMVYWKRPEDNVVGYDRSRFFAENNCTKISHLLTHECLRLLGRHRKEYFSLVHDLWEGHVRGSIPFLYHNDKFVQVSVDSTYYFKVMDVKRLRHL